MYRACGNLVLRLLLFVSYNCIVSSTIPLHKVTVVEELETGEYRHELDQGFSNFCNCVFPLHDGVTNSKIMLHNGYAIERKNKKRYVFTLPNIISLRWMIVTLLPEQIYSQKYIHIETNPNFFG